MNPRAVLLIIVIAVVVLALVVWAAVWWVGRQAGVRRAEFARVRAERALLARAVHDISAKADAYRDLDSVLATDIRAIVRDLDTKRMEIDL
ncbi:hypothetical protein ACOBQX_01010 [Actinokineospora sp. G85]|uniref:hypothetical protein n=1 Tax=Actinokineospora sp. G85 TaxID=3406626 RepID=UPI003C77D92A